MRILRWPTACLGLALFALAGCSGGPSMSEVEGTLTLNGAPLDKIQVEFWPLSDGPRSIGVTDAQGRFTLASDDGKRKGAVVGKHKVVLKDVGIMGDQFLGRAGEDVDMSKGKKSRVAADLGDPNTTRLEREVTKGKCAIIIDTARP